jgi:hypothetical protein
VADGAETHMAEVRPLQLNLLATVMLGRIAGELSHLRAHRYPLSIPLVPHLTTGIDLLYLVGLSSMLIPRLVTWRGVGEVLRVLILVDRSTLTR